MSRGAGLVCATLLVVAVSVAPAAAQDDSESPTTTAPAPTTTTVELSAPVATSTPPPVGDDPTEPVAAPDPPQVLGAQESDGIDELALTGVDIGALAALGLALVVMGGATLARNRRG